MPPKKIFTLAILIGSVTASAIFVGWTKPNDDPNPLAAGIKKAVAKSLPLLQNSGHKFVMLSRDHCVSCHNNLLTGVLEEKMMQKGLPVIDSFRTERTTINLTGLATVTNLNTPDNFVSAKFIAPYSLIGLHADKGQPNPYT